MLLDQVVQIDGQLNGLDFSDDTLMAAGTGQAFKALSGNEAGVNPLLLDQCHEVTKSCILSLFCNIERVNGVGVMAQTAGQCVETVEKLEFGHEDGL